MGNQIIAKINELIEELLEAAQGEEVGDSEFLILIGKAMGMADILNTSEAVSEVEYDSTYERCLAILDLKINGVI